MHVVIDVPMPTPDVGPIQVKTPESVGQLVATCILTSEPTSSATSYCTVIANRVLLAPKLDYNCGAWPWTAEGDWRYSVQDAQSRLSEAHLQRGVQADTRHLHLKLLGCPHLRGGH